MKINKTKSLIKKTINLVAELVRKQTEISLDYLCLML